MSSTLIGLPGVSSARTAAPRRVFWSNSGIYLPSSKIIDGALSRDAGNTGDLDVLRAGLLMGKITSGGKYAPSIFGVTTNSESAGSTSIQAAAAVITELVRRVGSTGTFKLTGPPSANGTVATETVTYSAASTTNITVTAIANTYVAGSFITATDGSETPLTFIADDYGVKVTDQDAASVDVPFAVFPVGGVVDSSQLINWPSDTSLRAWIMARINSVDTGKFIFDHNY